MTRCVEKVQSCIDGLTGQLEDAKRKRDELREENRLLKLRVADLEGRATGERGIETTGCMELPVDRDGVPLHIGDVVYGPGLDPGGEDVFAVRAGSVLIGNPDQWSWNCNPELLTHKQPARYPLDADGVECRPGDMLWPVKDQGIPFNGVPLTVAEGPVDEFGRVPVLDRKDVQRSRTDPWYADPGCLSHTEPDSWERLEEDCSMSDVDYCDRYGLLDKPHENPAAINSCVEKMAYSLVHRAKALAGATPKCSEATPKGDAE